MVAACIGLAACDSIGDRHVLAVDATGTVVGLAYIDRDGDREHAPGSDTPLAGARVALVFPGTGREVADATTDASGTYRMSMVPVGRYEVRVGTSLLGDSLRHVPGDSVQFTVAVGDTTLAMVVLGYPDRTTAEARALPAGRLVTVEGVALNASAVYSDNSVHVADSDGVVRVLNVGSLAFEEGDTVRVTGRTGVRQDQPVITAARVRKLRDGDAPTPQALATAVAATADEGALDAGLVRVEGTTIIDARGVSGGTQLTVNDGSGPLVVLLDQRANITSSTPFQTGAEFDATGLLAPIDNEPGRWRLKPRSSADVVARVPLVTVAEARELPVGRRVRVEGVALNGWATFGDGSLHVADPTGAIRVLQVPSAFIFAGDELRVSGQVGIREGQSVLLQVTVTNLGSGTVPPPHSATTETAATANGGSWDAALVRIEDAEITDTATVGVNFQLTLDDGSGELEVLVTRDTGIGRSAYVPGVRIDATGLLVPLASGTAWRLQPRAREDLRVRDD